MKTRKIPQSVVISFYYLALLFLVVFVAKSYRTNCNKEERIEMLESANLRLRDRIDQIEGLALKAGGNEQCPLWPIPSRNHNEIYHEVVYNFLLPPSSDSYRFYILKEIETGIHQVGIIRGSSKFIKGDITKTTEEKVQVLGPEESRKLVNGSLK